MTLDQLKQQILIRIEQLAPSAECQPLDVRSAFRWHPISFEKALSLARQENPNYLIWNCCEYKNGYTFLVRGKPDTGPVCRSTAPSFICYYFHVNYNTGKTAVYGWTELEMNMRFSRARERKTVWIDVSEAESETQQDNPKLCKLKEKLLSITLLEETEHNSIADK